MSDSQNQTSRRSRIDKMDQEILTVEGAAEVLGVSKTTIYQLVQAGAIPGRKVGKEWRFTRKRLIAWISEDDEKEPPTASSDKLAKAARLDPEILRDLLNSGQARVKK